jgi:hypothetical protein
MPDYLSLVGQVLIFTFANQVAVVGAGVRCSFYRVYGLLKGIVQELIAGKMQLAEVDTIIAAQPLPERKSCAATK